jgi:hypothetical protein
MIKYFIPFYSFLLLPSFVNAACDCGSTDQLTACTGNSLQVTVADKGSNGDDIPSVFTWNFNSGGSVAACGQFANGDYWIAPASGETDVTVSSVIGSDQVYVDADPVTGKYGILPAYTGYDPAETLSFPMTYSATTSLVAATKRDSADPLVAKCGTDATDGEEPDGSDGNCVDSYNVITILDAVPANCGADMIRPNITGATKEFLTLSDFDFTRLPIKDFLTGTTPQVFEDIRQRWSHSTEIFGLGFSTDGVSFSSNSEAGRAFRSHNLIDDYAAGAAARLHSDVAAIFSDDNVFTEKKAALAAIITYGNDLYHAMFDTTAPHVNRWGSGAGQHLGKFTPVVLLAALEIDNPERLNNVRAVANEPNSHQPQELAQLHVGPNGPVWGDDEGYGRYWGDLLWSGCYDTNINHIENDYWIMGEWKTFQIPVGGYYTGLRRLAIGHSNYNNNQGDLIISNVLLDGEPINFNDVTLGTYGTGTGQFTIINNGTAIEIDAGVSASAITTEEYNITAESVLRFDMFQLVSGWSTGIGFDDNDVLTDGSGVFQMTGGWEEEKMIQIGCNPSEGKKTAGDPHIYIDGPANLPGSAYFGIGHAGIINFASLMLLMPEFHAAVNTEKPITFVNRTQTHGLKTLPDPCVNVDTRENSNCDTYTGANCDYYYATAAILPTWGPKSFANPSECGDTEIVPYTQSGRFATIDGKAAPINVGYISNQLLNNWNTLYVDYTPPSSTCSDLTQNGEEEGIDCGGSCPNPCETPVLQGQWLRTAVGPVKIVDQP